MENTISNFEPPGSIPVNTLNHTALFGIDRDLTACLQYVLDSTWNHQRRLIILQIAWEIAMAFFTARTPITCTKRSQRWQAIILQKNMVSFFNWSSKRIGLIFQNASYLMTRNQYIWAANFHVLFTQQNGPENHLLRTRILDSWRFHKALASHVTVPKLWLSLRYRSSLDETTFASLSKIILMAKPCGPYFLWFSNSMEDLYDSIISFVKFKTLTTCTINIFYSMCSAC